MSKTQHGGTLSKIDENMYSQRFDEPPQEPYEPKDLGYELYETVQTEYKAKRHSTTYDPKALYDFWKIMKKARGNGPPPKATIAPVSNKKMAKYLEEKNKHKYNLHFYLNCDQRDVKYTLEKYAKEDVEDVSIQKQLQLAEQEQKYKRKKEQKKKAMDKDVLGRLYNVPTLPKEESKEQKESKERSQFVQKIITHYKFENPDDSNFRKPDIILAFWNAMEDKAQAGVNADKEKAKEDIEIYFQERCEIMLELFQKKNGYQSEDSKVVAAFWKKSVGQEERIKYHIDFESEANVEELLRQYIQQKKDQENISNFIQQKSAQEKAQEDREKLQKSVLKKEVSKTPLQDLAKPKDRLLVGKTLLELQKMHPDDKVLRKMLLQEFSETRVAKHPLEYDVVDSDEENKLKMRHPKQKGGVVMRLEELELPEKMKAEEIAELFEKHLSEFYSTKQGILRQQEKEKQQQQKEDLALKRFVEKAAQKYLQLRKRRMEEKVQSLNEFLSHLYRDCKMTQKVATKRNFPHTTYGESKRLRQKSFPTSFKRYFFACLRGYLRKKYNLVKDKENRLAFWVPTNTNGQSTLNRRVQEQSRQTKEQKIKEDKPETSVWDKNGFMEERQKIMMTFSDAKECTFQPQVGTRMPNKLKRHMRETHNWAPTFIDRKGNLENFLNKFGENFKKFPKVFKYGIYKRAQVIARRGEFLSAYKLIAENFDLRAMKIEFNDPDRHKEHPTFNYQKMGIEDEQLKNIPIEDFKDESNRNFLFEVYTFVKKLEKYEFALEKSKKNLEKIMSQTDRPHMYRSGDNISYATRRNLIKNQMCPLGQSCPSLQQRWPNSNTTGITPLGAECMFAHHTYELKFSKELIEKRRILKDVLKKVEQRLSGEQKAKPWNPGGGNFQDCIGCGENLGSKGNKGLCVTCQMRKTNLKRLAQFAQKAKEAHHKITDKESFKRKDENREKQHQNLNKKMACLARASALYAKEHYSEAFKVIIEAVEIIKIEMEANEKTKMNQSLTLKTKLGLDREMDVTKEQVFLSTLPDRRNEDDPQEPQKLHMFAIKTGLITDQEPDVNQFVNLQVERMYLKIEQALQSQLKDIEMMKTKIEKLEDAEDQIAKGKKSSNKTKMCPEIIEKGACDKGKECNYAHSAIELDLVPNEKKIDSLGLSIKKRTSNLRESKPPVSWMAASVRGATDYQDTKIRDREAEIKRLKSQPKRDLSKTHSFRDHSAKTIFNKDIDDLKTPVDERRKRPY